jgi:hypothetical protein
VQASQTRGASLMHDGDTLPAQRRAFRGGVLLSIGQPLVRKARGLTPVSAPSTVGRPGVYLDGIVATTRINRRRVSVSNNVILSLFEAPRNRSDTYLYLIIVSERSSARHPRSRRPKLRLGTGSGDGRNCSILGGDLLVVKHEWICRTARDRTTQRRGARLAKGRRGTAARDGR